MLRVQPVSTTPMVPAFAARRRDRRGAGIDRRQGDAGGDAGDQLSGNQHRDSRRGGAERAARPPAAAMASLQHAAGAEPIDIAGQEQGACRRAKAERRGRDHDRRHAVASDCATAGAIGPRTSEFEPITPMHPVSR